MHRKILCKYDFIKSLFNCLHRKLWWRRNNSHFPYSTSTLRGQKSSELFRSLGKGVNEFRKAKNEWEQDINDVMNQEPLEDHDFSKEETTTENDSVSNEGEKQTVSS